MKSKYVQGSEKKEGLVALKNSQKSAKRSGLEHSIHTSGMQKGGKFMEGEDAMVGQNSFANMPNQVIMQAYPKNKVANDREIDDTILGIDNVVHMSEGKRSKYMSNQK
jgi:hypothetical protein